MTTDIFSEGLQIPIVKYQDRGKVNEILVDMIRRMCGCRAAPWATCARRSRR